MRVWSTARYSPGKPLAYRRPRAGPGSAIRERCRVMPECPVTTWQETGEESSPGCDFPLYGGVFRRYLGDRIAAGRGADQQRQVLGSHHRLAEAVAGRRGADHTISHLGARERRVSQPSRSADCARPGRRAWPARMGLPAPDADSGSGPRRSGPDHRLGSWRALQDPRAGEAGGHAGSGKSEFFPAVRRGLCS